MSKNNKRDNFTFFNEEWNAPYWEDGVDEIDKRNKNKSTAVED